MRRRIGIGMALFLSMLSVILILALTIGWYSLELDRRHTEWHERAVARESAGRGMERPEPDAAAMSDFTAEREERLRTFGMVFFGAIAAFLAASFLFSRLIKAEFDRFARKLARAEASREPMNADDQSLSEFAWLAGEANRMIETARLADERRTAHEKIYRSVIEDLSILVCRFRPDGILTFVNDAYCGYFGRSREELLGTSFFSLIPEESHGTVRRHYSSLTPESPSRTYDHQVFASDGEIRWQRWTDRALFENGTLLEYQSVGEDITESRRAEEAIRVSGEKLSRVFRLSPNIMVIMDAATREILEVNDSFVRLLGYRAEEVIGQPGDRFPVWANPEDRREVLRELAARRRIAGRRIRFRHRGGEVHTGLFYAETMDIGERRFLLITVSDITDLEQAREEYLEAGRRLTTLMDNLPGLAYRCRNDANWTFDYVSEGALALTGYSPAELTGNRVISYNDLILPEDRDMVRKTVRSAVAERRRFVVEYRIRTRAGEIRWVWEKGTGVYAEEGAIPVLEGLVTDITERRRAEDALRESEHNHRTLIESMDNALASHRITLDDSGRPVGYTFLRVNDAFLRMAGKARDEVEGKPVAEIFPKVSEDTFDWAGAYGRVALTGVSERFEQYSLPLGKWLSVSVYSPQPGYFVTNFYDITPRVEAERALRESEENLTRAQAVAHTGSWRLDIRNNELRWSAECYRIFGIPEGSPLTYETFLGIVHPEDREYVDRTWKAATAGGPYDIEHRIVAENSVKWVREQAELEFGSDGTLLGGFGTAQDITERKEAEEALRFAWFSLEQSRDTALWVEESGRMTRPNEAACRFLGYSPGEMENLHTFDIDENITPETWPELWRGMVSGEIALVETMIIRKDGVRKPVEISVSHFSFGGRDYIFASGRDITERKRAEEELREEKERLAVTLRSIGDGVITTDRAGRVMLMNRVAEELTGWLQEDAEGRPLDEVFHSFGERTRNRRVNPFQKVFESGDIVETHDHTLLISRDGREVLLEESAAPILDHAAGIIGMVLVFRDVTDRKRREEELQKMEKLESVGVLAGGIAHDFNNILTGVIGSLSLARLILPPESEAEELLREAERQSLRARDLTGQLLTFSRGGAPIRITASIVETVRETVNFTIRGSRVRAVFSLPEDLWSAQVDLNQVSHVFNNLALNAVQAMPNGGRIEVGAHNVMVDSGATVPLEPGPYILLSIRDTGTGIPREHLPRIFDPYFTTKQMGSGLGLATTYSIIKRHDGHIEVESEPSRGTVFRIYFPAAEGSALPPEPERAPAAVLPGKRVLVMDDDQSVRDMAALLLEAIGYTAETVSDGEAALDRFRAAREAGEPFDAVIMDLTIPDGMGGREAITALLAYEPGAKAIVSSGYSTDPVMAEYQRYGFSGVLTKPYRLEEIATVLREVMDG